MPAPASPSPLTSAVRAHAHAMQAAAEVKASAARAIQREDDQRARMERALACLIADVCARHFNVPAACVFESQTGGRDARRRRDSARARACAITLTRTGASLTRARVADLFGMQERSVTRVTAEIADLRETDRKLDAFLDRWETALCGGEG